MEGEMLSVDAEGKREARRLTAVSEHEAAAGEEEEEEEEQVEGSDGCEGLWELPIESCARRPHCGRCG